MKFWERFKNYKERGEWVELQFMAKAARHCLAVVKPWGDTRSYDVGVEHAGSFLRVQVKSTTARSGCGYTCAFVPHQQRKSDYSLDEIDLFAAYVIPEDVWYLIPAAVLLGKRRKSTAVMCPVSPSRKTTIYQYERYREAWNLLTKSREELLLYAGAPISRGRRSSRSRKPEFECPILARYLREQVTPKGRPPQD
jgi:PD-(D/E)XK endonuclease